MNTANKNNEGPGQTGPTRFSKKAALSVLDARATRIAAEQKFNRSSGTFQLIPVPAELRSAVTAALAEESIRAVPTALVESIVRKLVSEQVIDRAVEYGRMRAFEQFAEAIEEGFSFEPVVAGNV